MKQYTWPPTSDGPEPADIFLNREDYEIVMGHHRNETRIPAEVVSGLMSKYGASNGTTYRIRLKA